MPYFDTDELRELPDMGDDERFPDARLEAAHDWIASIIERECDTSFIVSTNTERLSGTGSDGLWLSKNYVRSVTAASVDGTALTSDELTDLVVDGDAVYLSDYATWSNATPRNVTVTYTYGYSTEPPADLKEAAMRAARYWLVSTDRWSGVDSRATSISGQDGTFQISVAGEGRPTGLPDVDATIMAWARRVRVPAIA